YNSARGVSGIKSPDGCASCATAETIPPADPFLTRTPSSIKATTTLADMEGLVTQAEDHGGGWVQLVMHHVCEPGSTGCSDVYSMSPTIFGQFLDWLQTRSAQGTVVKTVDQVIGGSVQPAVDGPAYPTQPGNLVKNPSLEETSAGMPVCFDNGGYGTNTPAYATTSDAHSGSVAETLTVTAWTSGDQKLITKQDSGECSIAVTPGQRYDVGVWYKGAWSGSASADVVMFYEDSTGVWKYWKDGPAVPSTSVWSRATYVTPVVPAGATHLWFGLALVGTGTVTTDDYSAAVHVGGPNPPGTPAVSVASPTSIKVSWPIVPDASVASYTAQAFLNNVLVSQRNCTTATLTCTVSGLTTGTAYTFKVITHGTTGYGDSVYSAPSVVIKPA
ncbi:MAG TPA: fibronectin type III domain-containing protein, partial [Mycobacterium sp.]|nr:fibronectin type III domain-containing protein [Mycobacterium sp.]